MPSIRTRLATAADMTAMIPIVNAAFAIETFLEGTRTDQTRMAEMMQSGEFLLAEDGAEIVGCVYYERRGQGGYFGMLAIAPDRQGQGLSRALVAAVENHSRQQGCRHMDLTVLSLRPELPAFYRKLGYIETGTEEFLARALTPGTQCHCIKMSKPL